MTRPQPKGWCPSAYRPMRSGDGYLMRIKPHYSHLSTEALMRICELCEDYGSGLITLTNRANLQIRGVSEAALPPLLSALAAHDLVDPEPEQETRRMIVTTPNWREGDGIVALYDRLIGALPQLPKLSAKFGYAIAHAQSTQNAAGQVALHADMCTGADLQIFQEGRMLWLYPDGAGSVLRLDKRDFEQALMCLCAWFARHMSPEKRRMRDVVAQDNAPLPQDLPGTWMHLARLVSPQNPPGPIGSDWFAPVAYGMIAAQDLAEAVAQCAPRHVRITHHRAFLFANVARAPQSNAFCIDPDDVRLTYQVCPGAPFCSSARATSQNLADQLAQQGLTDLHISACPKGCAAPLRQGRHVLPHQNGFDLVKTGHAWDEAGEKNLDFNALIQRLEPVNAV